MFKIQKFDLLISIYIFCVVVSELMGGKTFAIYSNGSFHLNASVAIFVVPVLFCINDIITEVFGKQRARSVVRSGLVIILMVLLYSILATALPPSTRYAGTEKAYDAIFEVSIRIAAASLTAFIFSEFLDVYLFAKLRERFGKKNLWLRTNVANIVSQFIDTTVFIVLAFYALNKGVGDNTTFLWSLILPYWLLKCFMSAIETPFVYLGVKWLRGGGNQNDLSESLIPKTT